MIKLNNNLKVIVIGAGLAGLYSAYLLTKLGFEVVVLEARDRVGGRTYSIENVDLGGSWVSTQQPRIYTLCKQLNLDLIPQNDIGNAVLSLNGVREVYTSGVSVTNDNENNSIAKYIKLFEQWAREINLDLPFYQNLDAISLPEWLKQNVTDIETADFFNFFMSGISTTNKHKISMLFFLFFIRQGRGIRCLMDNVNGAQEFRVKGGAQTIAKQLASSLTVVFNQQVVQVRQNKQYQLTTQDGQIYVADLVISAIPVNLIPLLKWYPALEPDRVKLYNGMTMGSVTKLVVMYDKPFWRDNGYNGECFSNTPPIAACFDGSTTEYFAIIVFVAYIHNEHKSYTDTEIIKHLAVLLDNDLARNPTKIYRKDWPDDKFSRGCYFCVPKIGDGKLFRYLSRPCGQIYFAGTEFAHEWYGYMEGAIESAIRVVDQIKTSSYINIS